MFVSSVMTIARYDQRLQRLALNLPTLLVQAKAPSTVDKYSRAFTKFKTWAAGFKDLQVFPANTCSVGLYLQHLIESNSPYSRLESAVYGINWAHQLYGFDSPCASGLVMNILEAAKRQLKKPVQKKEPVTIDMLTKLCEKYASESANLSDLRVAAICVTAFHAFLRFSELASLRCCDVKFMSTGSDIRFAELFIIKSKTDVYRDGNRVLMAETADHSCPFKILFRYVEAANIDLNSSNLFFRTVYFYKSKRLYKLRSTGLSYSRTRELGLSAFSSLGYSPKTFGLHSLRSGGVTVAANAGVHDRLFKRHGRLRSETAKDGYVKDKLDALLSVSKSLHM